MYSTAANSTFIGGALPRSNTPPQDMADRQQGNIVRMEDTTFVLCTGYCCISY